MSIMITSEVSKEYTREEDAIQGFKSAVENGQVRLALQILADVIDGMMEMFNIVFEDSEEETKKLTPVVVEKNIKAEKFVEEKETAAKKPAIKKEEIKIEAE